jgi:hypothetical protein
MSLTFTYEWLRDGIPINGANSPNYVVTDADAGHTLTFKVSGENGYGATVAISLPFIIPAPTSPTLPVNTIVPVITTATVGISTNCSTGTWIGTAPISYTYQWYLNRALIVGQTSNVYTPISGDIGKSLYCIVTGTNIAGQTSAQSNTQTVVSGGSYINIPDSATLYSMLTAGPIASGGKSYLLGSGNFGTFGFYGFNFTSNPITITGQSNYSSIFDSIGFSGSSGLTLNTIKVTGATLSGNSIQIVNDGDPAQTGYLTFNQVITTSSDAQGTQTGGGWELRELYGMDITINGQGDNAKPDVWGRTIGMIIKDTGWNGGTIAVNNMTFQNMSIDCIVGSGAQNVTINRAYITDMYNGVGDHPDSMQFFSDGTTPTQNLTITNCGMQRGMFGNGSHGIFLEDAINVLLQNNWVYIDTQANAYSNARGSGQTNNNNFGQGFNSTGNGGNMITRGGAVNTTCTNNSISFIENYAADGVNPGYIPATLPGTNIIVPNVASYGDFSYLDTWLAANPTARRRT